MNVGSLGAFIKERDETLLSLDESKMIAYMEKYEIEIPENKTVFWASIHKARISIVDFPENAKRQSRRWLKKHGFSCEVK